MSDTPSPGYRIIGLRQEGFKRIKLVDITPERHLVKITGKNEQGKSSLMDGIGATLDGGSEFLQTVPIQVGRDKSVLRLTIGDNATDKVEMIVTKTIRPRDDGTFSATLVVENAEGFRAPSPQKMLESFLGPLTFDPLKFMSMRADKQFDQIAAMVPGIDFSDIARKNASDYAKRTEVNRDAKRARAAADAVDVPDSVDAQTQPIDEAALTRELAGAATHNARIETRKTRREQVERSIADGPAALERIEFDANARIRASQDRAAERVAEIEAEIARLKANIVSVNDAAENDQNHIAVACSVAQAAHRKTVTELQESLDAAEPLPEPIDTDELGAMLNAARGVNQAIRTRDQRREHEAEAERLEAQSEALTAAMEAREKEKEEAIAKAELPVPGLSLGVNAKGDGIVLLDGLPLAQASHARKLRTSAQIAMSMNTKLKVMLLQEAAFLDEDNMEVLNQLAIDNDYQVFVELVDSSGKVGFVLEDGHIAGQDVPEPVKEKPTTRRRSAKAEGGLL